MTLNDITKVTGIPDEELRKMIKFFDAEPRYYHNSEHILDVCEQAINFAPENTYITRLLVWSALFHDYIYDPKSKTNEEDSARKFLDYSRDYDTISDEEKHIVYKMILDTKNHVASSRISSFLIKFDLASFSKPFYEILAGEMRIRKEYEWVDWQDYKRAKREFFETYLRNDIVISEGYDKGMKMLRDHILYNDVPKIAIYAGSFNPFHIGHLNIYEKASRIFDKVIIARGINPDKDASTYPIPKLFKYNQVDYYTGSLPKYLLSRHYPVTLIRGLRNTTDLQYELTQQRWLEEFVPSLKTVSIICDAGYEHISSSAIRTLEKYDDLKSSVEDYLV